MAAARAHTQGKQSHCPLMANASPLRVARHWGRHHVAERPDCIGQQEENPPRTDRGMTGCFRRDRDCRAASSKCTALDPLIIYDWPGPPGSPAPRGTRLSYRDIPDTGIAPEAVRLPMNVAACPIQPLRCHIH
jgi:hypothetical protein